jgi:hypothetical protein
MPATRFYRPRMVLRLTVPLPSDEGFDPLTFDVPVVRARHVRNDHNHADTLHVTLDWVDTGVDPRWIAGATCEFYIANADDRGNWEPGEDNIRFVGRLVEPARSGKGDTLTVEMEFHDYTSFYLLAKPFATKGIPLYSETLGEAWIRICDNVPGTSQLADNLELRGLSSSPRIGSAVAERFRKRGSLNTKPDSDAWAIWQQAVGMMGLISFFELDRCVITTAEDYYTGGDPPRIVWGKNLLDFTEKRNNNRTIKGVGIQSFDPIAGKTLESLYNPLAGNVHKKIGAKSRGKAASGHDDKEYDIFQYSGITEQAALDALAKRVYAERSRQELEGALSTAEMEIPTGAGEAFDLLSLASGDTIDVRFVDTADAEFVKGFDSREKRVKYLEAIGYSGSVANIIAANVDSLTSKSNLFYCKTVTTTLEATSDGGGSFRVDIEYMNKIDPTGGAATS